MLTFSLPLVGGFATAAIRSWNKPFPPPEFSAPSIAFVWICAASFFFGAILFRPWAMVGGARTAVLSMLVVGAILGFAAALESIWRKDWYVYLLSSVSFVGTALGVMRVLDSLYAAALKEERTKMGTDG
jgi:hypothetical protein